MLASLPCGKPGDFSTDKPVGFVVDARIPGATGADGGGADGGGADAERAAVAFVDIAL